MHYMGVKSLKYTTGHLFLVSLWVMSMTGEKLLVLLLDKMSQDINLCFSLYDGFIFLTCWKVHTKK